MSSIAFITLALLTIASALMVVFSRNPVFSVLYLVVCFFSITGHYILLQAHFLAAVNLIVYAGAIMVLFLFVIMLLNLNKENEPQKTSLLKAAAIFAGSLILILIAASSKSFELQGPAAEIPAEFGTVKAIGKVLFTEFLLPFEVASVLLISAMVGALILAKKHHSD
jgi:NADH-quinone oxidoreductase subunit J